MTAIGDLDYNVYQDDRMSTLEKVRRTVMDNVNTKLRLDMYGDYGVSVDASITSRNDNGS